MSLLANSEYGGYQTNNIQEGGDPPNENECPQPTFRRQRGMSLWLASVFIVGEMAGSGALALPRAIADAGWSGVMLLLFCCVISLYAAILLSRCWTILEERYEEYREQNRHPYAAIAYRAVGIKMKYFVSFSIDINLLGVGTVFLLLSSQLISSLTSSWGISFCYWMLILAAPLCLLMWLGTPNDFWPAALIALVTTATACVLIIILIAKEAAVAPAPKFTPPTLMSFFLSFGTILFAFGGAATFPTFQNDMRDKNQFPLAITIGFGILLVLYLPVAILGYKVFGDSLPPNVLDALPDSNTKSAIQLFLALHMFFAFLLVCNSPAQDFEEFLGIPKSFGWKRIALRTGIVIGILFVAQSIPRFGKVLNLVGGFFAPLTCSLLPCFLYYRLCSQKNDAWIERSIPPHEMVILIIIAVAGIVGGALSTYSAISDIVKPDSFNPPCYINITAASEL